MKKILFSLPCAGGRAANYDIWKSHINFELINIEYPGHWGRWGETACTNINDLVEDVTRQISDRGRYLGNGNISDWTQHGRLDCLACCTILESQEEYSA